MLIYASLILFVIIIMKVPFEATLPIQAAVGLEGHSLVECVCTVVPLF